MKKLTVLLCGLVMIAGLAGTANAVPFSVTHDYYISGTYQGETYQEIFDIYNWIDWVDTFTVPDVDPAAATMDSANFSITHAGNISTDYNAELWLITDQQGQNLGSLSESPWGTWTTDTFALSQGIIDTVMGSNPWSLGITISEETGWIDTLYVDEATFAGQYTSVDGAAPVPEPATLLLLGTGLMGIAGIRRKHRNRKT